MIRQASKFEELKATIKGTNNLSGAHKQASNMQLVRQKLAELERQDGGAK